MTTFPDFVPPGLVNCSPGTTIQSKPRVRAASFGDGYVQRTPDGLNADLDQMDVSIDTLTREEAQTVITFFKSRKGCFPFMFKAPGDTDPKKWICSEWSRVDSGLRTVDIRAKFFEVVDP